MNLSSLCRREVVGISANAGLREAAESMESAGVRRLLVVDDDTGASRPRMAYPSFGTVASQ